MSVIFRPHALGGLEAVVPFGEVRVPVLVTWDSAQVAVRISPDGDYHSDVRIVDLLGWLLAQLGSHSVEFSQRLLVASPCLSAQQERATALVASEDKPTVAGLPIAPAQEKTSRGTSRKRDKSAADKQPAPAETAPSAAAPTATATSDGGSAFTAEMQVTAQRQEAARSPAEPRFRDEAPQPAGNSTPEPHVEMDPPPIDKLVDLLTQPPMPPDLSPVDWRRSPADARYADTAITRLAFLRCLEPEYMRAGAEPHQPVLPQVEDMIIDVNTQHGVMAFVNLLVELDKRATERGIEIPQVSTWLMLYRTGDVLDLPALQAAAWDRLQARKMAEAQRLTALQNQAKPVQSAPAYANPAAHGAHPSYIPPTPPAQPPVGAYPHQPAGAYPPPAQPPYPQPAQPAYYPPQPAAYGAQPQAQGGYQYPPHGAQPVRR